ncbi:MAG TPA: 6-hydroxycyclohex-1-ene-1-carbonyl-CoA dehydrogenase [Candidatus Polarisedimenticolia bacterium]|nr:6-hydroxycyclohex-1-ene-1-carbonyl-CoA dehydrogenase [Candidatus Polarisedimenticolia bacterium]
MRIAAWVVREPAGPIERQDRDVVPGPEDVVVQVAGCGVCHTDLGFYHDGVPTRHPFPLTLGHEISGTVVQTGPGAARWLDRSVIVPAVIPCGRCDACAAGRQSICGSQIFPGNDVHGGFASHVLVPSHGLCAVPDLADSGQNPAGVDLATLSVVADAVSTPWQAIRRSGLAAGDLAVFVGIGGVGGFGAQLAAAAGALVVAIDVDDDRLGALASHGVTLAINAARSDFKRIRAAVRELAEQRGVPTWRRKIFETSGTTAGQSTAFGLLERGGWLSVIGFTPEKLELRLSNLMALDATAQGNWGCAPSLYPEIVTMALTGRVALAPFVEKRPLSSIAEAFEEIHARRARRRIILVPEA